MWDVDNRGLEKIEDVGIANAILERVNNMNANTAVICGSIAAVFAALPQSSSAPLAGFLLAFGGK
jgi:hypothetical protein